MSNSRLSENTDYSKKVTKEEAKDVGLAFSLVFLVVGYLKSYDYFLVLAIVTSIANIIIPSIYTPFVLPLRRIGDIVGGYVTKIMLSILFMIMVTPLGILLRIFGKDPLQLRKWKKDSSSVFVVRDHMFDSEEIERPY